MALSRLKFLSPEDQAKFLGSIGININAFPDGLNDPNVQNNPILKEFEKTGIVPKEITNPSLRKALEALPKDQKSVNQKYVDQTQNEADLTNEELQNRLEALQGIQTGTSTGRGGPDVNSLAQAIYDRAYALQEGRGAQIDKASLLDASKWYAGALFNGIDPQTGYANFASIAGRGLAPNQRESLQATGRDLFNEFSSQDQLNPYYQTVTVPGADTSLDQKRIRDLISTNTQKADSEKQVEDYLTALPGQLKSNTDSFIADQTQNALSRYNEQVVPQTLQAANSRGAFYSSDVGDMLSTQAYGMQNDINSAQQQLEAQDNQTYFNAAYQNKIRQLLESNANVSNALSAERQNVLTDQANQFTAQQNSLNQNQDMRLYNQEAQRQASINQQNLARQRSLQQQQNTANLYGGIGTAVGGITGAFVGGPIGATVGSQIGGQAANIPQASGQSVPSTVA